MFMPDNSVFVPVKDPNMTYSRTKNQRLDMDQRLTTFEEVEKTYTEEEALLEASRCMCCPSRWCSKECPAGMPVPEFIKAVRGGDYEGAYALISSASPLPEFCSRLCPQEKQCQSNCTRAIRSEAVGVGRLERFVVEQHYASGAPEALAPATGKTVCVVGSGPSGLSAAVTLAKLGHSVTVISQEEHPGGLLRYGIPGMKLPESVLDRKLDAMLRMGIAFQTGLTLGKSVTLEELKERYDGVVLALGTGNPRDLNLNGEGVHYAVPFLTGEGNAKGKDVVIVGGGDTGNDCVGTALRQDAASITQVEMLPRVTKPQVEYSPLTKRPGESKFDSSQEECVHKYLKDPHIYQATVKALHTDAQGALEGVTLVHLEKTWDENRRLVMKEILGSEERIPCQLLIVAAGFIGPKAEHLGLETTSRTNIAAENYQTSMDKVFACGDCRTGQSLVVKAMVDGRECAKAVDEFLK